MLSYFKKGFPEYLEREPHSVTKDKEHFRNSARILEESKCNAGIVHFRKISVGEPQISNTHPFIHHEWTFCHNGTIFDSEKILLKRLMPSGTTDSERFFLYLLERLEISDTDPNAVSLKLKQAIRDIQKEFKSTSLTFLLTDGTSFFANRECNPEYEDYYTLYRAQIEGANLFCSEPLAAVKAQWESIPNGSLLAV